MLKIPFNREKGYPTDVLFNKMGLFDKESIYI